MSYNRNYSTGANNDFERLSSSIRSNIQKLSQSVSRCQSLVNRLGTTQDSTDLTGQIKQLQHESNELSKTTSTQLRNLTEAVKNSEPTLKKQRELVKNRLTDEFTSTLNKVQKVQREAADKERESVRRARAHSATATSSNPFADADDFGAEGGHSDNLVSLGNEPPSQKSMQAVMEEEENLAAIQEREAAIKSLESDILDVNEIFKDLGQLVYEQGEMIDSIEGNVENAVVHVEQANTQLETARQYQSSARRKKFICFGIIFLALVILILVIVLPIVLKNQNKN